VAAGIIAGSHLENIAREGVMGMGELSDRPGVQGPPWGWQPSLEHMARETGVDFNRFLELVKDQVPDDRMAAILGVSPRTVRSLREHFDEFGMDSVQGQD
jgi:hypothetical protein